jgi:DNA adenine methylase
MRTAVITKNSGVISSPGHLTKNNGNGSAYVNIQKGGTAGTSGLITNYNGGKNGNGTYQQIINLIPPHRYYVEPFVGSGAIYRRKLPAVTTVLNDKDPRISKMWADQKIEQVIVYNKCALQILSSITNKHRDAFVYIDPPYLFSTRISQKPLYDHEAGDADFHTKLLKLAAVSPAKVMISGYENDLYNDLLPGWHKHTFRSMTRKGMATETLWMNYKKPVILHDDRYLGDNFRRREKIKIKREGWMNRFRILSPEVRMSILTHINREFL